MTGRRLRLAAVVAALATLAGCASAPPAPSAPPARDPVLAYEAARREAWAPRRFKALFRGEVAPRSGVSVRGYLSTYWDGETLVWKASVPLGGSTKQGVLTRFGTDDSGLVPGRVSASDVLAALLGVPDRPADPAGVRFEKGRSLVPLAGGGRAVWVASDGQVVGLVLPGGVEVRLEPGVEVPHRIEARGPEGSATLVLESLGPWPEGEAIPGVTGR